MQLGLLRAQGQDLLGDAAVVPRGFHLATPRPCAPGLIGRGVMRGGGRGGAGAITQ